MAFLLALQLWMEAITTCVRSYKWTSGADSSREALDSDEPTLSESILAEHCSDPALAPSLSVTQRLIRILMNKTTLLTIQIPPLATRPCRHALTDKICHHSPTR